MPKHVLNDQTRAIAQLIGKEDIDYLIDRERVKLDEHGNVLKDLYDMAMCLEFLEEALL